MIRMIKRAGPTFTVMGLMTALPAQAAIVSFSGSSTNANSPPVIDGSCPAATPFRLRIQNGPGFATGTSNLGSFTYTQTHCTGGLPGLGPYSGGVFSYSFAQGDMLEGSYSGALALSGTPGVINNAINLVVTGGTGRFLGATGSITGVGTLTIRPGQDALAELALDGTLNLPAVPEPATWAMMIGGFILTGGTVRRRRTVALFA